MKDEKGKCMKCGIEGAELHVLGDGDIVGFFCKECLRHAVPAVELDNAMLQPAEDIGRGLEKLAAMLDNRVKAEISKAAKANGIAGGEQDAVFGNTHAVLALRALKGFAVRWATHGDYDWLVEDLERGAGAAKREFFLPDGQTAVAEMPPKGPDGWRRRPKEGGTR